MSDWYWDGYGFWCGRCSRLLKHLGQTCLWCNPIPHLPDPPVSSRNGWTVEIRQAHKLTELTMHHKLNPTVRYRGAVRAFTLEYEYESGPPNIYEINDKPRYVSISWEPLF